MKSFFEIRVARNLILNQIRPCTYFAFSGGLLFRVGNRPGASYSLMVRFCSEFRPCRMSSTAM